MSTSTVDLWPSSFGAPATRAPVVILREQAALLSEKTGNVIEGEVQTQSSPADGTFRHWFNLRVPALDNYRYGLFWVEHDVRLYPATVSYFFEEPPKRECQSEGQLEDALRQVFHSAETAKVIQALLIQVSA